MLSTFILLVKAVMFVLHVWYPLLSTITNAVIVALWCVSIYGQMGPDHSDPQHSSNIAWYISKSCDVAKPSGNHHNCVLAKSTFAVTVIMMYAFPLFLFLLQCSPVVMENIFDWQQRLTQPQGRLLLQLPLRHLVYDPLSHGARSRRR